MPKHVSGMFGDVSPIILTSRCPTFLSTFWGWKVSKDQNSHPIWTSGSSLRRHLSPCGCQGHCRVAAVCSDPWWQSIPDHFLGVEPSKLRDHQLKWPTSGDPLVHKQSLKLESVGWWSNLAYEPKQHADNYCQRGPKKRVLFGNPNKFSKPKVNKIVLSGQSLRGRLGILLMVDGWCFCNPLWTNQPVISGLMTSTMQTWHVKNKLNHQRTFGFCGIKVHK